MKKQLLAFALLCATLMPAHAQLATVVTSCPPTRSTPYPPNTQALLTVDVNGNLCATVPAVAAADPCQSGTKIAVPISQTANTKLFSAVAAKKNYICSFVVIAADAENVSLLEGTGSVCASATQTALIGGLTAAAGINLAANGGITLGNGNGTIAAGATVNTDVCLFQSASGRVAGVLTYVQQ